MGSRSQVRAAQKQLTKTRQEDVTPQQVLNGLVANTAESVLNHLKVFENLVKDYPNLLGVYEVRVSMQAASLALVEASKKLAGEMATEDLTVMKDPS